MKPNDRVCVNNPDNDYHLCDGTIVSKDADGTFTIKFTDYAAGGDIRSGFRASELVYGWLHGEASCPRLNTERAVPKAGEGMSDDPKYPRKVLDREHDLTEVLNGTPMRLEHFKGLLEAFIESYGTDARIVFEPGYTASSLLVKYETPETDDEYNRRVKREREFERSQKMKDRAEYERLKAKLFPGQ